MENQFYAPTQTRSRTATKQGRRVNDRGTYGTLVQPATEMATSAIGESEIGFQIQKDALIRELISLQAAFYEDYGHGLDRDSVNGLKCFMRHNPNLQMPMLSAESAGTILATWTKAREHVTLRFVDRYNMHFAITLSKPEGPSRSWGKAHTLVFSIKHPEALEIIS